MALITFMSDYGWRDHYVAAMKASILRHSPSQAIVDITHEIEACNLAHGAYVLRSVFREFAPGTVHLTAVDASGPLNRPFVMVQVEGHYFLGPDNGMLSLISEQSPELVRSLPSSPDGGTFPEKAVLPQAAVHLAQGKPASELGEPHEGLLRLMDREPRNTRQMILGCVIHIDHYGNLITNICREDFDILSQNKTYSVKFGRESIPRVQDHMHQTEAGDCFIVFNSQGLLQVGIRQGNASELLGMYYESPVRIEFHGEL